MSRPRICVSVNVILCVCVCVSSQLNTSSGLLRNFKKRHFYEDCMRTRPTLLFCLFSLSLSVGWSGGNQCHPILLPPAQLLPLCLITGGASSATHKPPGSVRLSLVLVPIPVPSFWWFCSLHLPANWSTAFLLDYCKYCELLFWSTCTRFSTGYLRIICLSRSKNVTVTLIRYPSWGILFVRGASRPIRWCPGGGGVARPEDTFVELHLLFIVGEITLYGLFCKPATFLQIVTFHSHFVFCLKPV